jgi:hypothetical protein
MTTLAQAASTLYQRLAQGLPALPVWWPNADFRPPPQTLWVQVQIRWGQGTPSTMHPPKLNTIAGQFRLTLYAPQGEGDGPVLRLADQIRPLYNRMNTGGVRCDVMSGPQDTGWQMSWYTLVLTVNFTLEESE